MDYLDKPTLGPTITTPNQHLSPFLLSHDRGAVHYSDPNSLLSDRVHRATLNSILLTNHALINHGAVPQRANDHQNYMNTKIRKHIYPFHDEHSPKSPL